jgi:hypothetical protein
MKILKTKTYEKLLQNIEDFEIEIVRKNQIIREIRDNVIKLQEQRKECLLNFKIRKCIIGKRTVGKTFFIQKRILPQLENFFVIDMTEEYSYLSENDRYSFDRTLSIAENKVNIIAAIKKNINKTIIIECCGMIDNSILWVFDLLKEHNFIIVLQSFKSIKQFIDFVDTIYLFDCFDFEFDFYNDNNNKFLNIPRHDI